MARFVVSGQVDGIYDRDRRCQDLLSGLPTRIEGYRRRAEDARSKAENTGFGKIKVSWLQLARLWHTGEKDRARS